MNLRTRFPVVTLCAISAHAGYFLETGTGRTDRTGISGLFVGRGLSAAYYLGALDFAVNGLAQYRLGPQRDRRVHGHRLHGPGTGSGALTGTGFSTRKTTSASELPASF